MKQEYSSASTSIKQIPAGFKIVDKYFGWQPNTINFDIGGGKYNLMTEKLWEKSVTNLVYDPYNRSAEHNRKIYSLVAEIQLGSGGVDTVTVFNVLNVIKEEEIQLEVLNLAYKALKSGGIVFVRSTYMNPNKASGVTKSGSFQHYKTQKEYLEIVKKVFSDAKLEHGIIYGKK